MTSVARGWVSLSCGKSARCTPGTPASIGSLRVSYSFSWSFFRARCQRSNSASDVPASRRFTATLPPVLAFFRSACTWRKATGSMPGSDGLPASTMPKGAPANLASGGMPPVPTSSGKVAALASVRPVSSLKPAGSTMRKRVLSGIGAAKRISLTAALRSSGSSRGFSASALPSGDTGCSRTASATARGTGVFRRSVIGRSGRQGPRACSRSQLNSARKRWRTFHW